MRQPLADQPRRADPPSAPRWIVPPWALLVAMVLVVAAARADNVAQSPWRLLAIPIIFTSATQHRRSELRLVVALTLVGTVGIQLGRQTDARLLTLSVVTVLVIWLTAEVVHRVVNDLRETRARLADSDHLWATVFHNHPDPVVVHDLQGRILEANPAALQLFGLDLSIPTSLGQALPLTDVDYANVTTRVAAGLVVTWESRATPPGVDRLLDLEAASLPVRESGGVQSVIVTLRDVTERNAARAEVASVQHALDQLDEAVAIYDSGTERFLYVNQSAADLMGTTSEALIGHSADAMGALRALAFDGGVSTEAAQGTEGDPIHVELDWPRGDGTIRLDVGFQSLHSEGRDLIVVVCHDVSGYQETIESERAAVEKLRDVDRIKNAFLSAVSHELRTPLTVVRGMASTLARHSDSLDAAQISHLSGRIDEQARRLDVLLSDLLDLDRLAQGAITARRQDVDLRTHVDGILEDHPLAKVEYETPRANVDPSQFERILSNLLTNAAKYASTADLVVLRPGPMGGVEIVVADRGPGIPDDEKQAVFEPFRRLDDHHPSPGTGIGLSMVAEFAALHGGRAWVEDREGGGTEVHVSLPGGDRDLVQAPRT